MNVKYTVSDIQSKFQNQKEMASMFGIIIHRMKLRPGAPLYIQMVEVLRDVSIADVIYLWFIPENMEEVKLEAGMIAKVCALRK